MHLQEVVERCFYLEQLNPADRSRGRESSQMPGSLPACCSVTLGKSPRCSGSSLVFPLALLRCLTHGLFPCPVSKPQLLHRSLHAQELTSDATETQAEHLCLH